MGKTDKQGRERLGTRRKGKGKRIRKEKRRRERGTVETCIDGESERENKVWKG